MRPLIGLFYSWLNKQRKKLNLAIFEYEVTQDLIPGLYDIEVALEFEGQEFHSRAQDFDQELAVEKACAEIFERIAFHTEAHKPGAIPQSSSGYATHRSFQMAAMRAGRELIERDILMCNILTGARFCELDLTRTKGLHPSTTALRSHLAELGAETKWTLLNSDQPQKVVLCAIFGKKHRPRFGVSIGMGTSKNLAQAIEKATQEAIMMSVGLLSGQRIKSCSPDKFHSLRGYDFTVHRALGLHPETAQTYEDRFSRDKLEALPKGSSSRAEKAFSYRRMPLPEFFKSCPCVVVRAENPLLQQVIVGPPSKRNVNHARIREFISHFPGERLKLDYKQIHILA